MPSRRGSARKQPRPMEWFDEQLYLLDKAIAEGDLARGEQLVQRLIAADPAGDRVAVQITARLLADVVVVPPFALEILEMAAGDLTPLYLEQIFESATASDLVRWEARRRYGWPEKTTRKTRLAFLDGLANPDQALFEAFQIGTRNWPPRIEYLEEGVDYLLAMESDRRLALLTRLRDEIDLPSLPVLHAMLHHPDPPGQRWIIETLTAWGNPVSDSPLARLAKTGRANQLRTVAEAARARLSPTLPPDLEVIVNPPVETAYLSLLDGDGGQIAIVVRAGQEASFFVVNLFHNEVAGIKNAFGNVKVVGDPEEILADIEMDLLSETVELVEVDLDTVRGALARAVEVNVRARKPIPPAFELWEPFLHDTWPPHGEADVAPELDDAPYAGRDDLLGQSDHLFERPAFRSWVLPTSAVWSMMAEITAPKRGRWTERHFKPFIDQLVTPRFCELLRDRLRRQAWLLERMGEEYQRDLALAESAFLAVATPVELVKNPFLRAMVRASTTMAVYQNSSLGRLLLEEM